MGWNGLCEELKNLKIKRTELNACLHICGYVKGQQILHDVYPHILNKSIQLSTQPYTQSQAQAVLTAAYRTHMRRLARGNQPFEDFERPASRLRQDRYFLFPAHTSQV
jgi:hypothetical protein